MKLVALVISFFVAGLGALGVASPSQLLGVVRHFQTPVGIYLAAALRVVFGVALLFAAPISRVPAIIRILGLFIIVAGVITPIFGFERYRKLLDWWSARGSTFIRAWAAFALAFGLFLAYAIAL